MESKLIFENKELIIPGAKNSVLPIIAASLLIPEKVEIKNTPKIGDIEQLLKIIKGLGVKVEFVGKSLFIDASNIKDLKPNTVLVKKLRASFLLFSPLLFRNKHSKISKPGGCSIGNRKVDLHLKGLELFGCNLKENDFIKGTLLNPKPISLVLDYPSVGATEQLISLAAVVSGTSRLSNASIEPEVLDLVDFLNSAGAQIKQEERTFVIEGKNLHSTSFSVIPDRIFVATWIVAALLKRKRIRIENFDYGLLKSFFDTIQEMGVEIKKEDNSIFIKPSRELKPFHIVTGPFPDFPTDIQPFMAVLACTIKGESSIEEKVFEKRFKYALELEKIGAYIRLEGNKLFVKGSDIKGGFVEGKNLRGTAALCLTSLICSQKLIVRGKEHLDRGYEDFEVIC